MEDVVKYEVVDMVATITMNRPEKRNALSYDMIDQLVARLSEAAADTDIRCIVITGAGSAFCAGGDVDGMGQEETAAQRKSIVWERIQSVPRTMARIDTPIIAMVNGDAIGGGLDTALMCDMRLAARGARLAEGYVRLGLVPGDGGNYLLPRLTSLGIALELLLTGAVISAERAAELGIVNRVVDPEDLHAATYKLARRIAALPPLAVRTTKRMTYQAMRMDLIPALDMASSHAVTVHGSTDHHEAVAAFRERRPGVYRGT